MKFLLDMNLSRELGGMLAAAGHEWRHAGDVGLGAADDWEIVDAARASGEVILTHDLDFGKLLAFSGDCGPSVIIVRLRNTQTTNVFERVTAVWDGIEPVIKRGAVVTIEDATLRIRDLPIER